MAIKATAADRLRRLLAIVPWIVANPGVEVATVAKRFGLSEKELIKDLDVVWMVGLPPYTPDALVEVQLDDGRVWIHYADFFERPLRLTPAQGLALLAASDALLSVPGTDDDGPLARALAKLADSMGVDADQTIEVDLGDAEAGHLDALRRAASEGTEVEIGYYSYGRDEHTSRRIAPWRVSADAGAWYVQGWCHLAEGERLFRVDRIDALAETGEAATQRPPHGDEARVFHPGSDDPTVDVRLRPAARWVAEAYPCEVIADDDDGLTVRLVVTAEAWLERLLLRLGPDGAVIGAQGLDGATDIGQAAASRIRDRYAS
ncbi:MAG: helix-turn-helix transcriptional regulator [Acidimicrobiales bacterium]